MISSFGESEVRRRYAHLLLKLGRHEEAEEALDAADGIHPGNGLQGRMIRADLRLDQGRSAEALIGYKALANHPDARREPEMAYQLPISMARALATEGQLDAAVSLLKETRAQWRSPAPVYTLLTCQLALAEALRGGLEASDELIAEGRRLQAKAASPGQQYILALATAARQVAVAARTPNPKAPLDDATATVAALPESKWLDLRVYARLVRQRIQDIDEAE